MPGHRRWAFLAAPLAVAVSACASGNTTAPNQQQSTAQATGPVVSLTDASGFKYLIRADDLARETVSYADGTEIASPGSHFLSARVTVTNQQTDRPAKLDIRHLALTDIRPEAIDVYDAQADQPEPVTDIDLDVGGTHTYVVQTKQAVADVYRDSAYTLSYSDGLYGEQDQTTIPLGTASTSDHG